MGLSFRQEEEEDEDHYEDGPRDHEYDGGGDRHGHGGAAELSAVAVEAVPEPSVAVEAVPELPPAVAVDAVPELPSVAVDAVPELPSVAVEAVPELPSAVAVDAASVAVEAVPELPSVAVAVDTVVIEDSPAFVKDEEGYVEPVQRNGYLMYPSDAQGRPLARPLMPSRSFEALGTGVLFI